MISFYWKKFYRIVLLYRKFGLIDTIKFFKFRESLQPRVFRPNIRKKRYLYYMRKYGSRLGFSIKRGSFLRLRYRRYVKKLKSLYRKIYKKKKKTKYAKLTALDKRILVRRKKWPILLLLQPYRLVIKRISNNVFVNLMAVKTGNIVITKSAGIIGFRGSKKTTHFTAEKVVNAVAKQALDLNIFKLDVVIQAAFIDKYVKTALRGLRQCVKSLY